MKKISPFLWFADQAEEAANFYVSVFPNSRILEVSRYGEGGPGPVGAVMVVSFELEGEWFQALNGGPQDWKFSEAISFHIDCEDQAEVDYYWEKLGDGGEPGPCGWLKDKFGLSWQVVPKDLPKLLSDPDPERSQRAFAAMMQMGKLDIEALEKAAAG